MRDKKTFNPLPAELRKLGLNRKEAEIYLLLLERKSTTVLNISKETGLSRPTVYRTLQDLQRKELVLKGEKEKGSFFSANSPDTLLKILRLQRRQAEEQEREFLRIISALHSKYYLLSEKNKIRICQIKTALEDFSNTIEKNIFLACLDQNTSGCDKIGKIYPAIKKRLGKVSIREIFAREIPASPLDFVQRKIFKIPLNKNLGALIITDKIIIINKKQALCIEEESTVEFIKLIFEMLWSIKS